MLGLPSTTAFDKKIPKQKFYDNLSVSPSLKRVFVEQIQSIIWTNKIAPTTININSGSEVTEIEVFKITLSSDKLDESALRQMDKQIPYHILFVLEYNDKYQIWIGFKESSGGDNAFKVNSYYHTEWTEENNLQINLEGLDMDSVYENLVRSIGNFMKTDTSLNEQITNNEEMLKLQKQIEQLESKARREKNPRKKFELVQKIKKLEETLNDNSRVTTN